MLVRRAEIPCRQCSRQTPNFTTGDTERSLKRRPSLHVILLRVNDHRARSETKKALDEGHSSSGTKSAFRIEKTPMKILRPSLDIRNIRPARKVKGWRFLLALLTALFLRPFANLLDKKQTPLITKKACASRAAVESPAEISTRGKVARPESF